jgi:RNA polymerase sigma-70 factor (ECF subfamily)
VLSGVSRYEPRALFRTYLYGIALKMLAAERRKKAREGGSAEEAAELQVTADPDAALWVQRAIEKLDPNEREVLLLREYEQLSYAEIAALLRVPVNTVRSRLFRARMALKDALVPQQGAS